MTDSSSPDTPAPDAADVNWVSHILQEIRDLRQEMRQEVHQLRQEIQGVRQEIRDLRQELSQELRAIHARFERHEERMAVQFRWTVGIVLFSWLAVMGMMVPSLLQLHNSGGQQQASLAQLQSAMAQQQSSVAQLQTSMAQLQTSVAQIQSSMARRDP